MQDATIFPSRVYTNALNYYHIFVTSQWSHALVNTDGFFNEVHPDLCGVASFVIITFIPNRNLFPFNSHWICTRYWFQNNITGKFCSSCPGISKFPGTSSYCQRGCSYRKVFLHRAFVRRRMLMMTLAIFIQWKGLNKPLWTFSILSETLYKKKHSVMNKGNGYWIALCSIPGLMPSGSSTTMILMITLCLYIEFTGEYFKPMSPRAVAEPKLKLLSVWFWSSTMHKTWHDCTSFDILSTTWFGKFIHNNRQG